MAERYTVLEAISSLSSGVAKTLIALAGGAEENIVFTAGTFTKKLLMLAVTLPTF
jgi:hypothetical protein